MNKLILLYCSVLLFCCNSYGKTEPFSQQCFNTASTNTQHSRKNSSVDYELRGKRKSLYKTSLNYIQIGTLIYVFHELFVLYQGNNKAMPLCTSLAPQSIITLDDKLSLALGITAIMLKTIVYKTIAQLAALVILGSLDETVDYFTT